jgi:hypothetical protein
MSNDVFERRTLQIVQATRQPGSAPLRDPEEEGISFCLS